VGVRAVIRPLTSGATYQRGVYLLLGGVIALPYALLAAMFAGLLSQPVIGRGLIIAMLVLTVVIGAVPAFLGGTRALQIVAARSLLRVDLPDQPPGARIDRESRLRSALWFALHLLAGGVVGAMLFIALPMVLAFLLPRLGIEPDSLAGVRLGPLGEDDAGWLAAAGVLMLAGAGYAVAGLGALARSMAPALLGPSGAQRIAALEAQTRRLAERNRLARELHDSIGHALTRTTLQAAAARQLLGRDEVFVAQALTAIEETGRAAMADLDHVLGLLRENDSVTPQRTLADVAGLAERSGARVSVDGELGLVPPLVSREAFRIVQEGLTNAAKHGDGGQAGLTVTVTAESLRINLSNGVPYPATQGTGRGLEGMRERVSLLGGTMRSGADDGLWRLEAELPIGEAGQ
jgi:signal transduction histidine kinase